MSSFLDSPTSSQFSNSRSSMGKGKKRSGGRGGVASGYTTAPFHYYAPQAMAAGVASIQINPASLSSAILGISDGFSLFRVKKLRFRILALTSGCAVGLITSSPNANPATRTAVMELHEAVDHETGFETQWSRWVTGLKSTIAGPLPWYHTRAGTYDVTEYCPCLLAFVGSGTNVCNIEIYGVLEFKDEVPTASTPQEFALLRQFRAARDRDVAEALRRKALCQLVGTNRYEDISPALLALCNPSRSIDTSPVVVPTGL